MYHWHWAHKNCTWGSPSMHTTIHHCHCHYYLHVGSSDTLCAFTQISQTNHCSVWGLGWWYIKNKRRRRRMYNTLLPELQIDHSFSRGVWEASCCSPKRKRKVDGMYIVFGPEDCRHIMHLSGDLGELLVAGRSPKKKKQQSIQLLVMSQCIIQLCMLRVPLVNNTSSKK